MGEQNELTGHWLTCTCTYARSHRRR